MRCEEVRIWRRAYGGNEARAMGQSGRRRAVQSALRIMSWRYITRIQRRLQMSPCSGCVANDGLSVAWSGALASTTRSTKALCCGPAWALQLQRHRCGGMTVGTPNAAAACA